MNSRPKDPKTARNKNVLVIGGSGSGKTRFWLKPNLMQMHSSYVVTDPKGTILVECGKMLQRGAPKLGKDGKPMKDKHGKVIYEPYRIKILNTINFKKSMHYNPFAYIHSEKDILKLVTTLIANTKGEGKAGDDFWVKAETLLYCALIGYIHYEAPVEAAGNARLPRAHYVDCTCVLFRQVPAAHHGKTVERVEGIGKPVFADIFPVRGKVPVSYTHLDVYKRQTLV